MHFNIGHLTGQIQPVVLWIYTAASVAAFIAYYVDKKAARRGSWRIQENTLHILALLGGWPGACAAQRILRHKTGKQPFQSIFVVTVILNIFCFILTTSPGL